MTPADSNGSGLIAIGLVAAFIAALALFSGLVEYVVHALPTVTR